jgi:hypothetical protein
MPFSRKWPFLTAAILLTAAALLSSCQPRFDRAAMLQSLSQHVIVPTYADFAIRADTLAARAEALRDRPSSETLADAAEAWLAASTTWKETEAFELGPVRAERINTRINFWPTRPETIERALSSDDPLNAETIGQISVAARGLPALEYVLFDTTGQGAGNAELLGDSQRATRQRAFAAAVARDVADNAQALLAAWQPDGEDFAATWGQGGEDAMDGPQEAISMLTNRIVFLLEGVRHDKLGAPLGMESGGTPEPRAAEAWRSGSSLAQINHNLLGLQRVYHGQMDGQQDDASQDDASQDDASEDDAMQRLGLKDYLQTVDASLADTLGAQIERTVQATQAIPAPLHEAVIDSPAPVERAYAEVGRLLQLVEVDMMNVLGITLLFNDNDGD